MVQLASPAPWASSTPGLAFGATNVPPYNKNRPHMGKDWKWSTARPAESKRVVAPAAGIVEDAFNDGRDHLGWGNYVLIRITDRAQVRLAHHETGTVKVRKGQKVALNQAVGVMGDTGETNGVHLHEELLIDGIRVNPDEYRAPHGRHLPGDPVIVPKPTPAGPSKPKPPTPLIPEEDDDMTVYVQAKGQKPVYEIKDGKRRQLDPPEWEIIKSAFAAAGRKLPYSKGIVSNKNVLSIPVAGK